MNKRIEWIDLCKGIGIITMVCGHIGLPYFLDKYIHAWHMPIFYIISGYLFKCLPPKDTIKRKFKSLIIPYLNFALILWGLSFLKNLITNDINLSQQFVDIFTFNTIGDLPFGNSIWFLTSLFFTDIFFSFIKNYVKNERIIFFIIMLIFYIGILLGWTNFRFILGIDTALVALGFYYFGYCLRRFNFKGKEKIFEGKSLFIFIIALISTIGIFLNGYVNLRTMTFSNPILFYINAVIASLFFITLTVKISNIDLFKQVKSFLMFVGQNSLIFLVFNQIVIYIIMGILKFITINKIFIALVTLVLTIIILLILSRMINKYFKFLLGRF